VLINVSASLRWAVEDLDDVDVGATTGGEIVLGDVVSEREARIRSATCLFKSAAKNARKARPTDMISVVDVKVKIEY